LNNIPNELEVFEVIPTISRPVATLSLHRRCIASSCCRLADWLAGYARPLAWREREISMPDF